MARAEKSGDNGQVTDREPWIRITRRAEELGLTVAPDLAESFANYVSLLARWNRRINLTALALEPLSADALDRLIMEPLAAARLVLPTDRLLIDIGSGGGSPAIPLRLACPALKLVMVESKTRKAAFLREAIRQLDLRDSTVENCRLEELESHSDLIEMSDVVSLRAVRLDLKILPSILALIGKRGRIFRFHSRGNERSHDWLVGKAKSEFTWVLQSIGFGVEVISRP